MHTDGLSLCSSLLCADVYRNKRTNRTAAHLSLSLSFYSGCRKCRWKQSICTESLRRDILHLLVAVGRKLRLLLALLGSVLGGLDTQLLHFLLERPAGQLDMHVLRRSVRQGRERVVRGGRTL